MRELSHTLPWMAVLGVGVIVTGCLSPRPRASGSDLHGSPGEVSEDAGGQGEGEGEGGADLDAGGGPDGVDAAVDPDVGVDPEPDAGGDPDTGEEPEPETGRDDGQGCTSDGQCAGGRCLREEEFGFPGGYCTTPNCTNRNDCNGDGNACLISEQTCVHLCDGLADCREGYQCQRVSRNEGICMPGEPPPEGDRDRPDGAACDNDGQCMGGTCILEAEGYPGGYCTTVGCWTRDDCHGEGTACLRTGRQNYCIMICDNGQDCREGYDCRPTQGDSFCAPAGEGAVAPPPPDPDTLAFEPVCGAEVVREDAFRGGLDQRRVRFDIPASATSLLVVPFTDGPPVSATSLNPPGDGPSIDIFRDYAFQSVNPSIMVNLHPLTLPGAPQFESFVTEGGGTYLLDVAADTDVCHIAVPKRGRGDHIDLNIWLTGLGDLTAETAPDDRLFQRALAEFEDIYAQLEVRIGQVRYLDVPADKAVAFSVVNSEEEAFNLVSQSTPPDDTVDGALSVNVFFIRSFTLGGGGVLGISAGLPGAAGIHGTRGSGLVFSRDIDDSSLLGSVLAHEVGHFLGLPHTTEQGGFTADPFEDTPTCRDPNMRNRCPDADNLMFPFAGSGDSGITEGQAFAMQANPLIKGERTIIDPDEPPPNDGDPQEGGAP